MHVILISVYPSFVHKSNACPFVVILLLRMFGMLVRVYENKRQGTAVEGVWIGCTVYSFVEYSFL